MSFKMRDSVRSGAHELGEQWKVDRHLYLTEDKSRVVEEGDPEGRWLWAAPGRLVPMAQAKRLGALREAADSVEAPDEDSDEESAVEEKQSGPSENKMVSDPAGDKARPDAKSVRAWAKEQGMDVPAKGRIPDEVVNAYQDAHE